MVDNSYRISRSAKHYVGSIMFIESADGSVASAGTTLLGSVGLYYSLFHMSMSLLWACPSCPTDMLERIRHRFLRQLVSEKLVQQQSLPQSFLDTMEKMQSIREYANYQIGSKSPQYEYSRDFSSWLMEAEAALDVGTTHLINHLNLICDLSISPNLFQTTIGDNFGSDIIRLHVGKTLQDRIWQRLIDSGLTT